MKVSSDFDVWYTMWLQLLLQLIYKYHNFTAIFTKKEVEKQDMYAHSNEGMVVKLIILVGQVG